MLTLFLFSLHYFIVYNTIVYVFTQLYKYLNYCFIFWSYDLVSFTVIEFGPHIFLHDWEYNIRAFYIYLVSVVCCFELTLSILLLIKITAIRSEITLT